MGSNNARQATNDQEALFASPDAVAASVVPDDMVCRFCGADSLHLVVDLGASPLCESFLTREQLSEPEPFYPLQAFVCDQCFLVQVQAHVDGKTIFSGEYAYFSSFSDSWLQHCERYANDMVERLDLGEDSQVVEIASNDGYLLQYFLDKNVNVLGIEPAANVAEAAEQKGVPTRVEYFGRDSAKGLVADGVRADLLIGNNVLAHVPDLNDFVAGLKIVLADDGVLTMEFPHLLNLLVLNQFDTIYQEHYCYFSLQAAARVFEHHGLTVFDVQEVPTHGGSLRVFVRQSDNDALPVGDAVQDMLDRETAAGLMRLDTYSSYGEKVAQTKRQLMEFLTDVRRDGKRVAGYGAPGKGNTLLNYCGVGGDLIEFVVDRNPYKQGRFLPGTHIPIYAPEKIEQEKPDYVLILPWNLKEEIAAQLDYVRQWGARLVVPIPELDVF